MSKIKITFLSKEEKPVEKNLAALVSKHRALEEEIKEIESTTEWIFPMAINCGDLIERVYNDVFLNGFEKLMSTRTDTPLEFKAKRGWNEYQIRQAFKDVIDARISRTDLLDILKGPMKDIESFKKELEKAITENEKAIREAYDEKVKQIEDQLIRNVMQSDEIRETIFQIFQII